MAILDLKLYTKYVSFLPIFKRVGSFIFQLEQFQIEILVQNHRNIVRVFLLQFMIYKFYETICILLYLIITS